MCVDGSIGLDRDGIAGLSGAGFAVGAEGASDRERLGATARVQALSVLTQWPYERPVTPFSLPGPAATAGLGGRVQREFKAPLRAGT